MIRLILLLLFSVFPLYLPAQFSVSATKHDYTSIAQEITQGKETKYEQAKSIYQWICKNISYDTSYRIYTADECWEHRRGVCQAYCELFYRLAEPLEIRTTIVVGKTKDFRGQIEGKGHSWLLVEVEDGCIFIDPTWGAGGMKDNKFQQKENDLSWFHVDPYWMIFTHWPDDEQYQCLDTAIAWETFVQLPVAYPVYGDFGWNGKEVFLKVLDGEIKTIPTLYEQYVEKISLVNVPMQQTLRSGNFYEFTIRKKQEDAIVLIHDDEFVKEQKWECDGAGYKLSYMPVRKGTLKISVERSKGKYDTVVSYQVEAPNAEEQDSIERHRPYRMPELNNVKNLNKERWQSVGMDGHKLLEAMRKSPFTSVPILYKDAELHLSEVQIPFSEKLKIGETYTFSFIPKEGIDWKIINEKDWYGDWKVDFLTGRISMQVTPTMVGMLKLSVRLKEGNSYSTMISYQVVDR